MRREWVETSEWSWELRSDGTMLGRAVKNGFNALAWGAAGEHLGYWPDVGAARGAVERWLARNLGDER